MQKWISKLTSKQKEISEEELEKEIKELEKEFEKDLYKENLEPILRKVVDSKSWVLRFKDPLFEQKCEAIKAKHQDFLKKHEKTEINAKDYDSHEHRRNIAIALKNAYIFDKEAQKIKEELKKSTGISL